MVEEIPSSDSQSSTGSREIRYLVRFDYRGLHPAVHFLEEELDLPGFPIKMEKPTRGAFLTLFLFHEGYHAGQLGIVRRLLGKESVAK